MSKRPDYFVLAQNAVNRLDEVNERLEEISEMIAELQPVETGMLLFKLNDCGRGCLGCPHASWLTLKPVYSHKHHKIKLTQKRVKNPLVRVKTAGPFAEGAPFVKSLVKEAQDLLAEKEKLVKGFSILGRVVSKEE